MDTQQGTRRQPSTQPADPHRPRRHTNGLDRRRAPQSEALLSRAGGLERCRLHIDVAGRSEAALSERLRHRRRAARSRPISAQLRPGAADALASACRSPATLPFGSSRNTFTAAPPSPPLPHREAHVPVNVRDSLETTRGTGAPRGLGVSGSGARTWSSTPSSSFSAFATAGVHSRSRRTRVEHRQLRAKPRWRGAARRGAPRERSECSKEAKGSRRGSGIRPRRPRAPFGAEPAAAARSRTGGGSGRAAARS